MKKLLLEGGKDGTRDGTRVVYGEELITGGGGSGKDGSRVEKILDDEF